MKKKNSAIVLVFNSKGELALQLRAAKDKSYPLHWDFSAGGGIDDGEDPASAAQRELVEEIGLGGNLVFIGEEIFRNARGTDHLHIYMTKNDGPFTPDPAEVEKVEFFSFKTIERMLKSGEKFHPEFPFLWEKGIILEAVKK